MIKSPLGKYVESVLAQFPAGMDTLDFRERVAADAIEEVNRLTKIGKARVMQMQAGGIKIFIKK